MKNGYEHTPLRFWTFRTPQSLLVRNSINLSSLILFFILYILAHNYPSHHYTFIFTRYISKVQFYNNEKTFNSHSSFFSNLVCKYVFLILLSVFQQTHTSPPPPRISVYITDFIKNKKNCWTLLTDFNHTHWDTCLHTHSHSHRK